MERLLGLVDQGKVQSVIIAKLDRLTRSVKDLAELLERFQKRGVSLVSVAEWRARQRLPSGREAGWRSRASGTRRSLTVEPHGVHKCSG